MKKWKAWIWMLVIFLSGVMVGGGGTALVLSHQVRAFFDKPPKEFKQHAFDRLVRELSLTDEQAEKIRPILDRSFAEMQTVWRDAKPRIDAVMDKANAEIAPYLNEKQLAKFKKIVDRIRNRRNGPPPPPPPPMFD